MKTPTYDQFPAFCEYRGDRCRVLDQQGDYVTVVHRGVRIWTHIRHTTPVPGPAEYEDLKRELREAALARKAEE